MNDVLDWIRANDFDLTYLDIDITLEQNNLLRNELLNFVSSGDLTPLEPEHRLLLAKRLEPGFGSVKVEVIADTELTRAYAAANLATWRESGVAEGKEWFSIDDDQTCSLCRRLHQTVMMLHNLFQDKYDAPPAHAGCRCILAPFFLTSIDVSDYMEKERRFIIF